MKLFNIAEVKDLALEKDDYLQDHFKMVLNYLLDDF